MNSINNGTINGITGNKIIYVVTSQESDKSETIIHKYSVHFSQAKVALEKIALDHLKTALGRTMNDHMDSPLNDTIRVEDISQGLTIRYRVDKSGEDGKATTKTNDRIIDMIKIERTREYYILPTKKRNIITTFKIVEVEPISESGSLSIPIPGPVRSPNSRNNRRVSEYGNNYEDEMEEYSEEEN